LKPAMNQATMMPHDIEKFLDAISLAGFKGVELRINKARAFVEREGVDRLLSLLSDKGLELLSLNSIALPLLEESPSESFYRDFEDVCKLSSELGAPYVVTIPCVVPEGVVVDRSKVVERGIGIVKRLAEIAHRSGIGIIVEPLGLKEKALRKLEDGVEIVKRVNMENVYTMLDTFHVYVASSDFRCLEEVRDKIAMVHISDTYLEKDKDTLTNDDRLLPGYGGIDLKSMVDFVKSLGYDYYISIESFRKEYWEMDPYEFARKAFRSLEPFL